jgi:hypothetical protein
MDDFLLRQLEEERNKLNELGAHYLDQHIALAHNHVLQEQSRKVDELILRYTFKQRKAKAREFEQGD